MRELDLLDGRVPSLEVLDAVKELRILAQRACDRAEPADVFRMPPAGIVAPAVAVRDECWTRNAGSGGRGGGGQKIDGTRAAAIRLGGDGGR